MPLNLATADDLAARDARLAALESRAGAMELRASTLEPAVTLLQAQVALLIEKVLHLPDPPPEEDPPAPPAPPATAIDTFLARPLVTPAKFKLVGGWRIPNNFPDINPSVAFVGKNLTGRENSDGSITFGMCWGALLKCTTTGPMGTDLANPSAWPLMAIDGVDRGLYATVEAWDNPGGDDKDPSALGCLFDGEREYMSGRNGYATPPPTDPFLVARNARTGAVEGPWGLPGGMCQTFGGGLGHIPQVFADDCLNGQRLCAGRGGYESGQGSTAGPSLVSFDPRKLAERMTPDAFKVLIQFGDFATQVKAMRERRPPDYSTPIWSPEPDGDVGYWATDRVLSEPLFLDTPGGGGCCFWVVRGVGPHVYSPNTETFTGFNQKQTLYVYDPRDIRKVARGELQPHEIRGAFHEWPNPLPGSTSPPNTAHVLNRVEGATQIGSRVYLLHRWVWGGQSEWWPVIGVYEIQ